MKICKGILNIAGIFLSWIKASRNQEEIIVLIPINCQLISYILANKNVLQQEIIKMTDILV